MRLITRLALVLGMIVAVGCELRAGKLSLFGVVVAFWVALPFLLLLRASRSTSARAVAITHLVGAVLLVGSSVAAYSPTALSSSSTSALVFVFLPLWQLIGVGIIVLVADRLPQGRTTPREL